MSQFSRLNQGVSLYRSHYLDERAFVDDVLRICDAQELDLILPSHNETEVLARNRDQLGKRLSRLLPHYEHCVLFNNKSSAYDFVNSLGIPVPHRYTYGSPNELFTQLKGQGTVVIKMLTGNSAKGVFYARTPEDAVKIVNTLIQRYELNPERYPQIEQLVDGEGWGCSVLYWEGQPVADFSHRRLREKIATGGTSTLREVGNHAGIRDAAHRIFTELGWHGLAMCEFKVCPRTGKFWFIEVNPRMWGSISLAINAGVEFPYLAWLCATRGSDVARQYHANCSLSSHHVSRWLLGDLMLVAKNLLTLQIPSALKIVGEKVDSTDDLYWDDPLAMVGEVMYYVSNTLSKRSLNPEEKGMLK
jgi:predicted ATP-grasp superfamily ATP-dependent carboligase